MSRRPSPGALTDPADRHPEYRVLEPLHHDNQDRGDAVATAPRNREGLERPLVERARGLEGERGGQEARETHRRNSGLRDGGTDGETPPNDHQPRDVLAKSP